MKYSIQNDRLRVEVSSMGAEICSIQKADGTEYLWQKDPATWTDQAPNLFPYVGRMYGKKYQYRGQEYTMEIHGFAMTSEFVCRKVRSDYLVCCMEDTEETRKQYPFAFQFEVHYELVENRIRIYYIVKNREGKTMYFGIGGHPGFRVPMEETERFEEYYLKFPKDAKPERIRFSDTCFVLQGADALQLEQENRLPLRHDLFDDDAIVLKNMGHEVQLWGPKGAVLSVRYPQMDYLGLWHWPRTEVDYICIEPWCSLPSRQGVTEDLEEKQDLIQLEAYGEYSNLWEIEIF